MSFLVHKVLQLISFFILLSCENRYYATAFTIQNKTPTSFTHTKTSSFMVADPIVSSDSTPKITDSNGIEFTEGCTIQTSSELKAFQVSKKGFGSFDGESNAFIPLEGADDINSVPRADRCLVVPKGMRGIVTRVYDISEYDASLPIIVKFQDGEAFGGKFEPPVTFLMHVESYEVEVVE